MTAAEGQHCSCIYQHACFFLARFFERFRWKTRDARKIPENFRSLCVHPFHDRIVLRYRWRGGERVISELLYVIELQEFLESSFITDRATQTILDICAARRTG